MTVIDAETEVNAVLLANPIIPSFTPTSSLFPPPLSVKLQARKSYFACG